MITIDQIHTIAVCGAGTMGAGIAQVAAGSGYNTVLFDIQAPMLDKAREHITRNLESSVAKGRMTAAEMANTSLATTAWRVIKFGRC